MKKASSSRAFVRAGIVLGFLSTVLSLSLSVANAGNKDFPTGPDYRLTQGSLCPQANHYRYPEKIAYCERDVDSQTKKEIIDAYEHQLGYKIWETGRGNFKIDHLIPLCAGGSNDRNNLWPQHKTVYAITDPLEPLICQKMSEGKLSQAEAVRIVKDAKEHLEKVDQYISELMSR